MDERKPRRLMKEAISPGLFAEWPQPFPSNSPSHIGQPSRHQKLYSFADLP
jgi:hypothetical protein